MFVIYCINADIAETSSDTNNYKRIQLKFKSKPGINTPSRLAKPPFYSYGWADKELDTARKWTHNVRANSRYVSFQVLSSVIERNNS